MSGSSVLGLLVPSDIMALKDSYPQPWSVIVIKDTREVNGRTFYFFQDINTRRGGSMLKSSGSEPESSHGIHS